MRPKCSFKFQFTHPGKGATKSTRHTRSIDYQFQFTHPGKGATHHDRDDRWYSRGFNSRTLGRVRREHGMHVDNLIKVSIHAPWEGCDAVPTTAAFRCMRFNSRTLGRVRLIHPNGWALLRGVSIHAPWEGCDYRERLQRGTPVVSIHAPWEGCDSVVQSCVL